MVWPDAGRGGVKLSHQPRVLHTVGHLYPGGHVDNIRSKRANSSRDVVGFESSGKDYRCAPAVAGKVESEIAPRQRFPRSAKTLLASRVENDRVGRGKEHLRLRRNVRTGNSDRRPDIPSEILSDGSDIIGRGIGVKLNDIQSSLLGGSRDFLGHVVTENSDPPYARAGRVQDRASLRRCYASRPAGEDDTYVADSYFSRERGILWAGHAAELNFCEHVLSA